MASDPKITVGSNIRHLRKEVGWSQEQLADACSLHRTYIGAVERGERNISLENIVEISRALRVVAATLLEGVE
jgi:transcriptional regulator with XRE-family HTH domain